MSEKPREWVILENRCSVETRVFYSKTEAHKHILGNDNVFFAIDKTVYLEAIAERDKALEKLAIANEAFKAIVRNGSLTLSGRCCAEDRHPDSPCEHQIGAHKAFAQQASIAQEALEKLGE